MASHGSSFQKVFMGAAGTSTGTTSVENVFSTFLYTSNNTDQGNPGVTQTITNGIDLSGEGGLVWIKKRNNEDRMHVLIDTERGAANSISSSNNGASRTDSIGLDGNGTGAAFTSSGFTVGDRSEVNSSNGESTAATYVSWTFRKAPKFFDIVTYTGNATAGRTVAHNLGSVPGMIIIKALSGDGLNGESNWTTYHRGMDASNPEQYRIYLDTNAARVDQTNPWNDTAPTSSVFTIGTDSYVNANGDSYVAYLFAHNNNDGGFGPTEDQDIIKCGSYTGNGNSTGPVINLGFEAQWVFIKNTTSNENWQIMDSMRNLANDSGYNALIPNLSAVEQTSTSQDWVTATSTGFKIGHTSAEINENNSNFIYMAIRFPNMEEITDATKVFDISAGTSTNQTPFPVDMFIRGHTAGGGDNELLTRLLGNTRLDTNKTSAEGAVGYNAFGSNTSAGGSGWGTGYVFWNWKRAKGYFDVVAYTGNATNPQDVNHSLGVVPEMVWHKKRSTTSVWKIWHKDAQAPVDQEEDGLQFDDGDSYNSAFYTVDITGNSGYIRMGNTGSNFNGDGITYVMYLFATLAGVSKVGSVTHSGSSTDVDCGFSAGARLVLIKRIDDTGDWYIWDSARGIIAGNDPYLLLNDPATQVTNTDLIDPLASGFQISGDFTDGDYIFYAVA